MQDAGRQKKHLVRYGRAPKGLRTCVLAFYFVLVVHYYHLIARSIL